MLYRQLLVAIVASGGAFIFGTLLAWSAPAAVPIVVNEIYGFKVSELQFAWTVGLMALGGVLSCVLSGIIRSRLGTRLTLLIFEFPILIGWLLIISPSSPAVLMAGRLLTGLSVGCYCIILPIYVGEISANDVRGSLLSIFQVELTLGVLFTFVLGHFSTLKTLNTVCGLITVLYSLGFFWLPESPALLVEQERFRAAERSLKQLNGSSFNVKSEVLQLKMQAINREKSFNEIISTDSTRKAFAIMMTQFFFFQMCGVNVVLFYSTKIFDEAGVSLEPGISSIIVAIVQVAASFLTFGVADRIKRRTLLIFSNISMTIGLVGMGTFFVINDTSALQWLPVTSISIFIIAFSTGMGPVSYILQGEMFLQEAKAFVAPIGQTLNLFLIFVIGLTFPMLTAVIGMGPTFFILSGFCFLALLFTIFVIPETKGRSTVEIQKLLES